MNTPLRVNTAYLDCFSGVSGDMLLGALIHVGLDQQTLADQLAGLGLPGLHFSVTSHSIHGIGCRRVHIDSSRRQELRTLPDIDGLLTGSTLAAPVVRRARKVFRLLANAEAKVHGTTIDQVHFHEIGALDTIVDVVGTVLGLHLLGIQHLACSPLPIGSGFVDCAHGRLPLPAPAVCELLRGIPTIGIDCRQELVTPTGAALVAGLAESFGPLPPMIPHATGYGAGSRDTTAGQPNLLRLILGEAPESTESQEVEVVETNIDDWSPEGFPHLFESLFATGALDASVTPVQMKKGRPGFLLRVIVPPAEAHLVKDCILNETTAIGLRFRREQRRTLPRERVIIDSPWGPMTAKKVFAPDGPRIYPEYEECRRIAVDNRISLRLVYDHVFRTRID